MLKKLKENKTIEGIFYLFILFIVPLGLIWIIKKDITWYSGEEQNFHSLNTYIIYIMYIVMVISLADLRQKKKEVRELKHLEYLNSKIHK